MNSSQKIPLPSRHASPTTSLGIIRIIGISYLNSFGSARICLNACISFFILLFMECFFLRFYAFLIILLWKKFDISLFLCFVNSKNFTNFLLERWILSSVSELCRLSVTMKCRGTLQRGSLELERRECLGAPQLIEVQNSSFCYARLWLVFLKFPFFLPQ